MSAQAREDAARLLEAADWRMKSEEGAADRGLFADWLADPLNAEAWARLDGALELVAEHASDPRMVGFRRAALEDAQRTRARLARSPPRWRMRIAAAVLIGVLGAGAAFRLTAPDRYRTAFNERRVVTLRDGSRVSLDSDSLVTVRYGKGARDVRLLRGQARFDVAHDAARPFSVLAHDQKVVAVGTAFNVDITRPRVVVTLIEGRVTVFDERRAHSLLSAFARPAAPDHGPVRLAAGQQLTAAGDLAPTVSPADMRQALAWTSGQLIFDDAPLAEVVERVNHYAPRPITIAGARVGRLRVSGTFNTGDVVGFLDIVTHFLPVEQTTDADGEIALVEK